MSVLDYPRFHRQLVAVEVPYGSKSQSWSSYLYLFFVDLSQRLEVVRTVGAVQMVTVLEPLVGQMLVNPGKIVGMK